MQTNVKDFDAISKTAVISLVSLHPILYCIRMFRLYQISSGSVEKCVTKSQEVLLCVQVNGAYVHGRHEKKMVACLYVMSVFASQDGSAAAEQTNTIHCIVTYMDK